MPRREESTFEVGLATRPQLPGLGIWIEAILAVTVIAAIVVRMKQHRLHVIEDYAEQLLPIQDLEGAFDAGAGRLTLPYYHQQGIAQSHDNSGIVDRCEGGRVKDDGVKFALQVLDQLSRPVEREQFHRFVASATGRHDVEVLHATDV